MKNNKIKGLLLALPTILIADVHAAGTNETSLDDIVVSAVSAGRGSNVEQMDVSTTVISKEQIQKNAQFSLDQIINREMGVWSKPVPGSQIDFTGATVQMRGFGATGGEKVLVMVDGVPINDGIFKTVDWNQVPKDTIEKVEIIRGGGGATMWGNLAEGGVINIITKDPKPGEKKIGFAYGEYNTKIGDGAITLFGDDKLRVGLNLNTVETDGYNTAPKQLQNAQHLVSTASRTHNAQLSTTYSPTDKQKYFLKFNGHELLQDQFNIDTANNQSYKFGMKTGGKIKYSDHGSLNFNGFYDHDQMNKQNGALINVGGGSLNVNTPNTFNLAGAIPSQREAMYYKQYGLATFIEESFDTSFGQLKDFKVGMDARAIDAIDNNNVNKQFPANQNSYVPFGKFNWDAQNYFEGIFGHVVYSPNNVPLDVTLGLRQDFWQSVNGNGYTQLVSGGNVPNPLSLKSQKFDQFNPRLGLKYSFSNGIDIRAAAYRNFAAPGMNALFRSFASSTTAQTSNPNLVPESNFGQEVGIDFTSKTIRTQFTLFHNKLDNYISSVNICTTTSSCNAVATGLGFAQGYGSIAQNQNVGSAIFEGGEAFVEWQALDNLKLNSSVVKTIAFIDSFNSTFLQSNAATLAAGSAPLAIASHQINDVPTLVLTLGGEWNIRPDLTFGWSIKSWPSYWKSTVQNWNANYANLNDGATTADLNLSYQATKSLNLYVAAQNVSNAYYISDARGSQTSVVPTMAAPRMVLGGFKFDF